MKLFRRRPAPRTALVLGGGGNLGSIQVGQLRALFEAGVDPDVLVGCSVGALNAAAIAGNPTTQEVARLEKLWAGIERDDIFPTSTMNRGPWRFVRSGLSAYPNTGIRNLIQRWLRYSRFEEAAKPLWVVATSIHSGLERWFGTGDVTQALLASTALPGFFPPVEVDGERLVDGGVVNNVPISKALELGIERVYVLDVGNAPRQQRAPRRPYEVLQQAVGIARLYRLRTELDHIPPGVELHRLPSVDVGAMRFDDFSRSPELIERGYLAARSYLEHPTALRTSQRTGASTA